MAHDSYLQLISLDLDGMLNEHEHVELRLHLRGCAACAAARDRLSLIDRTFAARPEVAPPADLSMQVMARVAAFETRRRWYPWFVVVLTVILMAAVISVALPPLVIVMGLYKPLLDLPVISAVVAYASQAVVVISTLGELAARVLQRWLTYLTTDPAALAVVIMALSVAAIWIGMLETMKHMQEIEPAPQRA